MITEIKSRNKIFALLIDLSTQKEGVLPATNSSWPLQLLLMNRKQGHVVSKHMHKKIRKQVQFSQEAIVVIRGVIQASIFDRKGKFISKKKVKPGQCLLVVDGAHEIEVLQSCLMYEFKNGPYKDDKIQLK